jgi:excisionase family DNA binding protein
MAEGPDTTAPHRRLLDPDDAADYLGVARRSLTSIRWRQLRGIPAYKLGPRLLRFDQAALDLWLEQRREGPVPAA